VVIDDLGEQLAFHLRAAAAVPGTLRRHGREVVRLLAEVSFGGGALAVVGGTVGVIGFGDRCVAAINYRVTHLDLGRPCHRRCDPWLDAHRDPAQVDVGRDGAVAR